MAPDRATKQHRVDLGRTGEFTADFQTIEDPIERALAGRPATPPIARKFGAELATSALGPVVRRHHAAELRVVPSPVRAG
jgi:hypothetical protein